MTIRSGAAAASILLVALALAGCATPTGATPSGTAETPPVDQGVAEVAAAWLDDGRMIGVVTLGSSTCVPSAGDVQVVGQTITVELVDPQDGVCTSDMAPRATGVAVPEAIDTKKDVTIVVTGAVEGTATLDGDDDLIGSGATDYSPSAGWYSESGFVVLTWGSSTCAPTIESVTAKDEHAIALTFAEFPADQVCTMDMAPRLVVAGVPDGFDDEDDVTLTLAGGGVSATTSILGDR